MSLSYDPIEPVLVLDPIVAVENKRSYAVLKSGSQTTYKAFTTSSVSNSSIQFSCPPPSANVFCSRKVQVLLPVRLTFTALSTAANQSVLRPLQDAPRAFPIANILDTLSITLNNYSTSINCADVIQALMRYNTDDDLKNLDYSTTPTYQDQYQEYSSGFGASRNPLSFYADTPDGSQMNRGGFPFTIVAGTNAASTASGQTLTASVDMVLTENLYISPLYFGHSNVCGFYNLSTFDANLTFGAFPANRMWSHDISVPTGGIAGLAFATSTMTVVSSQVLSPAFSYSNNTQPLMMFKYITPLETQIIPRNMPISYPYYDVVRYTTDTASFAAGETRAIDSNNIQIHSIPRRMYVYVRMRNADLQTSAINTDTFFQINNLSIQFLNKNGLLASASMQQLYEMSIKNGCKLSWTQWSGGPVIRDSTWTSGIPTMVGTVGAVICIEFATDIGLDSLQAPGKLEQCQIAIRVNAKNLSAAAVVPSLFLVVCNEGTFVIQGPGQASSYVGVISSNDILDCQRKPFINYADLERVNGGDFWSGLKSFVGKVHDFVKDNKIVSTVGKALGPVIPFANTIGNVAESLGYGEGYNAGVLLGAANAGVMMGGKSMPKRQLAARARKHQ